MVRKYYPWGGLIVDEIPSMKDGKIIGENPSKRDIGEKRRTKRS